MVYLSATWGMGEAEIRSHGVNAASSSAIASSFAQENDEEVSLHPLSNQVRLLRILHIANN